MLHARLTRRVIQLDLFQQYEAPRICHLHSSRDGITTTCYTQRAFHLQQSSLRSQPCTATSRILPEWRKIEMCQSGSTRGVIINHWSSLMGLGFSRSFCLQTVWTLWSKDCQDSWKQCVGTNNFYGVLKTEVLKYIARRRTGPRDLHTINNGSH